MAGREGIELCVGVRIFSPVLVRFLSLTVLASNISPLVLPVFSPCFTRIFVRVLVSFFFSPVSSLFSLIFLPCLSYSHF